MVRGPLTMLLALGASAWAAAALAAAAAGAGSGSPASYFRVDAARHTVRLTLLAGLGSRNNGFNFDGYGRGELLVTVPLGWRVIVDCENRSTIRNSCAIVRSSLSTSAAFDGASTPDPVVGLSPGQKATFSFRALRRGTYRIASLVPGHEQARMWDVLDVVKGARAAISARPGP